MDAAGVRQSRASGDEDDQPGVTTGECDAAFWPIGRLAGVRLPLGMVGAVRGTDMHVHLPTAEWLCGCMGPYVDSVERYFGRRPSRSRSRS
jgi:hypothetical protein